MLQWYSFAHKINVCSRRTFQLYVRIAEQDSLETNERKSEQAHIPQIPKLLENAVNNEWQFQALLTGDLTGPVSSELHKIILAKVQKGYKLVFKKIKSAFPVNCVSTHDVLYNYKISRNSAERFHRSCANKKNRTDGLTDWLTDGSKTLYPPQFVAWGIKRE